MARKKSINRDISLEHLHETMSEDRWRTGSRLKYRLRMPTITGDAPRFKNLYLGGVGTLRALLFKSLGGNQKLLSNVESNLGIHNLVLAAGLVLIIFTQV